MAMLPTAAKSALIAIGLLAVTACSPDPTPTPSPTAAPTLAPTPAPTPVPIEPLRLGALDLGRIDELLHHSRTEGPIARSVLLAIQHVNDAGGVFGAPVEARFSNTDDEEEIAGANPAAAAASAARLVDEEGVHAIIGPLYSTDAAEIGASVAAPRRIPVITPISSSPLLTNLEDDGFVFRTTMSDIAQADALAQLAEDEGYDHVAVIYRNNYWGLPIDKAFEDHFDGKTTSVPIEDGQESYHEETLVAEAEEPDAVMLATSVLDGYTVIANIIEEGHFNETYLLMGHYRRAGVIEAHPELDGAKGVSIYGAT